MPGTESVELPTGSLLARNRATLPLVTGAARRVDQLLRAQVGPIVEVPAPEEVGSHFLSAVYGHLLG